MTKTNRANPSLHFSTYSLLLAVLLFTLSMIGCSRSPWMKTDGHEVAPSEQMECAREVQKYSKGEFLGQDVLEQRIEQCMLDKGYKPRPWWLFNDLHWHLKEPVF